MYLKMSKSINFLLLLQSHLSCLTHTVYIFLQMMEHKKLGVWDEFKTCVKMEMRERV